MRNRYEGLLTLDVEGKEQSVQDMIDRITGEFAEEGATVEQTQKMDKRNFAYVAEKLKAGYYVNFIFTAEPSAIANLLKRFKLDDDVFRQHYQKLGVAEEIGA